MEFFVGGVLLVALMALGLAALALFRENDTRELLDGLIKSLQDAGFDVRDFHPRSKHLMNKHEAPEIAETPVVEPPKVNTPEGPIAVGDWLQHYAPGVTWPQATVAIYTKLAAKEEVIDYFPGREVTPEVKAHFARVFVDLTRRGLYQRDIDDLVRWHEHVRNTDGEPITEHIWNEVLISAAEVLTEAGVPGDAIGELARCLEPIHHALVKV